MLHDQQPVNIIQSINVNSIAVQPPLRVYAASRSQANWEVQACRELRRLWQLPRLPLGQERNNDGETLAFDLDFTLGPAIAEARMLLYLSLG